MTIPVKNIINFAHFHSESVKRHWKAGIFLHLPYQNGQNLNGGVYAKKV